MAANALPYHEPEIINIIVVSSFLLLLNVVNSLFDRAIYCGLVGQLLLGVAWGTPGGNLLGEEMERAIVELGYLGLILLVYEGGLSTSFTTLKENFLLSAAVAVTGVASPIALSYFLGPLAQAASLQAFAAGAALCSTSLGTTFSVLSTTGLSTTRLGVVLSSAAIMDDVVGLVMVQVISNLGTQGSSFNPVVVLRPILVSVGFAVLFLIACWALMKTATVYGNAAGTAKENRRLNKLFGSPETIWLMQTALLLGSVIGATYAGTSNLFAAYLSGAAISYWDSQKLQSGRLYPHHGVIRQESVANSEQPAGNERPDETQIQEPEHVTEDQQVTASRLSTHETELSGLHIYQQYYQQLSDRLLKPLFFASIGFSIPIRSMFTGSIVWRGLVYALLMALAKMLCGIWLVRFTVRMPPVLLRLGQRAASALRRDSGHIGQSNSAPIREQGIEMEARAAKSTSPRPRQHTTGQSEPTTTLKPQDVITPRIQRPEETMSSSNNVSPSAVKPISLYPAFIVSLAMVARGEIGFLISAIAQGTGIFSASGQLSEGDQSELFLVVTWAIVLCTIIGPLSLGLLVRRLRRLEETAKSTQQGIPSHLGVWGLK